jgi:hypothetical protein
VLLELVWDSLRLGRNALDSGLVRRAPPRRPEPVCFFI